MPRPPRTPRHPCRATPHDPRGSRSASSAGCAACAASSGSSSSRTGRRSASSRAPSCTPRARSAALTIAEAEPVADGPGWWLRFREVRDRDAADALRGVYLEIDTPDEPREPGRWLVHELEGLAVRSGDGEDLGRIVELYHAGGADVFVVRGPRGELDVPGVRGIVIELAPERGEIDRRPRARSPSTRDRSREDYVRPRDRRPPNPRRPSGTAPAAPAANEAEAEPGVPSDAGTSSAPSPSRPVMTLEVDVLTLFPAMVEGPLGESIPARIQERGLAAVRVHDLRQWGLGKHRTVDDYTYGGGAGMVLRPEPVASALAELRRPGSLVILLDPAGEVFRQSTAQSLAAAGHLVLVCPRYEGVDERIRSMVDLELSIGDYVLTGGELAALVVVDAVLRLLPGAIDEASTAEESFAAGLLEYPQYTRPATFDGVSVSPRARLGPPRGGPSLASPRVAPSYAASATGPAARPGALSGGGAPARRDPRPARRIGVGGDRVLPGGRAGDA